MLVNPSGKRGKFRAVDWVEESMINLYTKVRKVCYLIATTTEYHIECVWWTRSQLY